MNRATIGRSLFFALVALLMLAELIFSNVGSLRNLTATAQLLGISVEAERVRLAVLILLDAIGGIGALMALLGYLTGRSILQRRGVVASTLGLLLYGGYQMCAGLFQLGAAWRIPLLIVGLVYAIFGLLAWLIGGRPRLTNSA